MRALSRLSTTTAVAMLVVIGGCAPLHQDFQQTQMRDLGRGGASAAALAPGRLGADAAIVEPVEVQQLGLGGLVFDFPIDRERRAPSDPFALAAAAADAGEVESAGLRPPIGFLSQTVGGPPDPKPGECYAKLTQPAQYRTINERVLDQPAGLRTETAPATYRTVVERVMVEAPTERVVEVPATYRTVTETVVVTPEAQRLVRVPARFETRTERVQVSEPYTTWKRGVNPIAYEASGQGSVLQVEEDANGEIMCLVEVPARFENRTRRVEVAPATTRMEIIPAVTREVRKRVIDQPATTRIERVPAKFQTIERQVLDQPARLRRFASEATYRTTTRRVLQQPARTFWASVLCQTNATPEVIRDLQRALKRRGLYRGRVDGIYGPLTAEAVRRFQGAGGLATMDSLRALGVRI